ncbi:hypothetical protein [Hydrogenimonas sp.]
MSSLKLLAAISAAVLLVWGGGALYLQKEIAKTRKEYLQKQEVFARYDALKALWSERARKKALKQMETMLRMYGIKPEIKKSRGKKSYLFSVKAAQADKVLSKLLNSNIPIERFAAKKISEDTLEVRVEVLQ